MFASEFKKKKKKNLMLLYSAVPPLKIFSGSATESTPSINFGVNLTSDVEFPVKTLTFYTHLDT
jgi:hypothetical protein